MRERKINKERERAKVRMKEKKRNSVIKIFLFFSPKCQGSRLFSRVKSNKIICFQDETFHLQKNFKSCRKESNM